ncbi:MAG: LytR C-terminal domain-containing protein [Candidatus Chisholmbacteria bacterium]|nr:LytR C-terminal domain-containing protein [Candidatus Chisholmbacteria bacterium]
MEKGEGSDLATKRRTLKLVGVGLPLAIAVVLTLVFFWQWWRSRPRQIAEEPVESSELPTSELAREASSASVLGGSEATSSASFDLAQDKRSGQDPAAEIEAKAYTFAVRNGAGMAGLAARFSRQIRGAIDGARVVETTNAEKTTYQESTLVSLIEDSGEAKRVAELLDLRLGDLPTGETEPEADFLVVVGRDQE